MATHQVTAYVFMDQSYSPDYLRRVWTPEIWCCKADETDTRIFLREQTFAVEAPDDFDPTAQQVAALERQKTEALATYQQQVAEINERLSKLQALTFEATP